MKNSNGEDIDEVFIVDIPEDITKQGDSGPLEGTKTTIPSPPKGALQRRLTFTAKSTNPGCVGVVRSSPDGSKLAFIANDTKGIKQIYTIGPLGGEMVQETNHPTDVLSGVRWNPDGTKFCYVWENSIVIHDLISKESVKMTQPTEHEPTNLVWSHDGKTIAFNRLVANDKDELTKQIFTINP